MIATLVLSRAAVIALVMAGLALGAAIALFVVSRYLPLD